MKNDIFDRHKVDKRKVKQFLLNLAAAHHEKEQKHIVRKNVNDQMERVKVISRQPTIHQPTLVNELESLQQKLTEALDRDVRGLDLNRKAINSLSTRINQLEKKIGVYTEIDQSRDKRLEKIEDKIVGKLDDTEQEIDELDKKIIELQKRYNELVESGKFTAAELRSVKVKIDDSKKILQKRKSQLRKKSSPKKKSKTTRKKSSKKKKPSKPKTAVVVKPKQSSRKVKVTTKEVSYEEQHHG